MPVNQPDYNTAVETNWDGVDQSEFEDFEQFASVHVWWNTETPETNEDVELPVAHLEDGQLKLVYEGLNSAHDLASQAIDNEEDVEEVRNVLENLREEEFPDREPLDANQNSKQKQEYEVGDTTIDITPPDQMVNAAEAAQEAQEEGLIPGECGTGVGDRRADQITNDEVGPDVVAEVASYLTSHEEDVTAEGSPTNWNEEEWSDCGNAQYAKWGGVNDGEMKRWAQEKANEVAEALGEELPYPERRENYTMSLDNPQFEVGDFVEWEFSGGSASGEIIEMTAEPGDSLSAGGNEFTVDEEGGENDEPLYKMQEWDEELGEEGEFDNNVVKFEAELSSDERPEAAPETAPRNRSKRFTKDKNVQRKNFTVKGSDVELKEENSDGDVVVNIPIQALSEDRDGDFINEKGQESIIRQLKSETVPLVPNHGVGEGEAVYDFTDIFGGFVDGENRNGTTIGKARLREGNEMTKELIDLLEQDMPVGFSVGFIPTEKEPREKEEGGMEISDLDLMEVSAVGIPSNPDAVPQAMGSAVAMAKNAGMEKQQIVKSVEKALNDTMSEKQEQDGTDQNTQDSKSEGIKQMTEEDVEAIVGMMRSSINDHMEMAMEEVQEGISEELMEEDEMDEDEDDDMEEDGEHGDDEDDDEEMSQSDASDHTEDEKSSESADDKSEEKEEVPSTVDKNQNTEGKDIETFDGESEEKSETEDKESEVRDPRMLV